jgi:hypothetical protein
MIRLPFGFCDETWFPRAFRVSLQLVMRVSTSKQGRSCCQVSRPCKRSGNR